MSATTASEIGARLRQISVVHFRCASRSETGWAGSGSGVVSASEPEPGVWVLEEAGWWQQDGGARLRFTNTFRWSASRGAAGDRLRLEHLRLGPTRPVLLFEMAPGENGAWHEESPHPCDAECYRATLRIQGAGILLDWLVRGPARDEVISTIYTEPNRAQRSQARLKRG